VGDYQAPPAFLVRVDIFQTRGYAGWLPPEQAVLKEARPRRRYAPGTRPVNRAEAKLREALAAFGIAAPTGRVLDLGAAPGGWTVVLAETAREVVAVDPAELDGRVLARPNVRHARVRAEVFLTSPDAGTFDMAVNDMNMDPAESATVLRTVAPLLRPGAPVVMTVKYVTRDRRRHRDEALRVLEADFTDFRWKRLPHNRNEVALCARRRG
jgi:23S rRNA C2498 (ribose-2'-O)-methylase RlmM